MSLTLQSYYAKSTQRALEDFIAAVERLPEDKRTWSPMGTARTALDQAAECAMLNGKTAETLQTHSFDMNLDMAAYMAEKTALSQDWPKAKALLEANTATVIEKIANFPDADLEKDIQTPWGTTMTLAQILAYPFWNMAYHEAQCNYLGSMLGVY